jgi:hypothetical protein
MAKNQLLKLGSVLSVLALSSCATHEYYMRAANSWKGVKLSSFQKQSLWGPCQYYQKPTDPQGGSSCVYVRHSRTYIPGYVTPSQTITKAIPGGYETQTTPGFVVPGRVIYNHCRTTFWFDQHNVLEFVRASDGCSTTEAGMRKYCNPALPCSKAQ